MSSEKEECPCNEITDPTSVTTDISSASSPLQTNEQIQIPKTEKSNVEDLYIQPDECKCCISRTTTNDVPARTRIHSPSKRLSKPAASNTSKNVLKRKEFDQLVPCFCDVHNMAYAFPAKYATGDLYQSKSFWERFGCKWPLPKEHIDKTSKAYGVKLQQTQRPRYSKPFMYFELPEGARSSNKAEANSNPKASTFHEKKQPTKTAERMDIYYFDHGNSAYYRTTDSPPILLSEHCAEKTDQAATRFWAEIFGTIHIGTSFVTAFILQLLRFFLFSIIRPLTVGVLQLVADYFFKPFLSILFNAVIQPVLILLYNVATSFRDLCEPLAETIGLFLGQLVNLCRSIRIIEINRACESPVC